MKVHQCDNCKKVIAAGELVIVGRDTVRTYIELCMKCAEPIMSSINKTSLVPELKEKVKEKSRYEDF